MRTKQTRIAQVRIVPRAHYYVVEVVYERDVEPAAVDPALVAGVDVGLNNLAAITSNKPGFVPMLVNGRPLKHINQWYNKRLAALQRKLGRPSRTKQMQQITTRRTRQIAHYLHTHSKRIIEMLRYKAALVGIQVIVTSESHTSKCSFLDDEPVCHQDAYLGKRIKRGLFRAADGRLINADVNGAYNIIRKAIPRAFGNGTAGAVVHPVGIVPTH